MAKAKGLRGHLSKVEYDINERVKELEVLYKFSEIFSMTESSDEQLLTLAVDVLPPAWQYPDITCARIVFENREYKSKNFRASKWRQSSDIFIGGSTVGLIEIYYLEKKPDIERGEGPFLEEERNLIAGLARQLSVAFERRKSDAKLIVKIEELERFQKILVGRELKMIELKKRIKELERSR